MKVSIAGAGGGIGRKLVDAFAARHEVTGIYRSSARTPARADIAVAAYGDAACAGALRSAQVVVHAALSSRARGGGFIAENAAITQTLLDLLDPQTCKLFVYLSSQVVYSAYAPADGWYRESDEIGVTEPIDSYTRLKLEDEARVIAACRAAQIPYLIVRPTVVMGPGMQWSSGIVAAMRIAPIGIRRRVMNLIHVDDLAADVVALVERGGRNTVYNLGDRDVSTDDYFDCAAGVAHRRIRFAPDWLAGTAGRLIPSTLWFLKREVHIDCSKIRQLTRRERSRPLRDYFPPVRWSLNGADVETFARIVRQKQAFQVQGQGYSTWFNDPAECSRLSLARYRGVLGLDGDLVTVKSGTPLAQVLDFLARRGMTLGTLPEFAGVSAGACFFTEVHGSSPDYVSMYDLIVKIAYVDADGVEKHAPRGPAWEQMRQRRGLIVTQVTFRCERLRQLANRIEWRPDGELEEYVAGKARDNVSTTIQWYPKRRRLLVYNVTEVAGRERGDRLPFLPFRGLPYRLQRFLIAVRMRGRARIVGKSHEILAPWKMIPARPLVGAILMRLKSRLKNMEICAPSPRAAEFIARLRTAVLDGTIALGHDQGIGVRFTAHPETGRSFVWIETTSRDAEQLHQILRLAREVCGGEHWLHNGKYVPQGTPAEMLLVPRVVPALLRRRIRVAAAR